MKTKNVVFGGALLAALLGLAPRACVAQLKPDMLQKIHDAMPTKPQVAPAQARKVLIYTRANGFVHSSIPYGAEALRILGEKTGAYTATISDDPVSFEPDTLKQYDVVVFESTTGDALLPKDFGKLDEAAKKTAKDNEARYKTGLLDFVNGGKGFVGIHAATDCYYSWPEYGKLSGGYFSGHPWHEKVGISNQDPTNPVNAAFEGKDFEITDEIYQFKDYSRGNQRVLTGLDLAKTNMTKGGINRTDGDFAVSWIKNFGQGRMFYCSLGHREEIYWNPMILKYYLAGIQFAAGDLKADTAALPLPEATKAQLRALLETPRAPEDVKDTVQGLYAGTYLPSKQAGVAPKPVTVNVVAWGGGEYRAVVDLPDGDKTKRVEVPLKKDAGGKFTVSGNAGDADWTGALDNGKLTLSGGGEFDLARSNTQSPTLGLKAPANAVVLMPFEDGKPTNMSEWQNSRWQLMTDGSVMVNGTGDQRTKREFGDMRLHVEFKPPLKGEARGQGRGNSGVYLQDRYEVQVLDSFGWPPRDNESGGIYQIAVPKLNAALPPTEWQTYDMAFRAPRLNADGTVKAPAQVTVYLNGQLIHDNVVIPRSTGGAISNTQVAKAPLRLQDHQNPVRFRNFWVVEENFADDQPLPSPLKAN